MKEFNNLFVMLDQNRFARTIRAIEDRVEILVEQRHEYPIWPTQKGPMDTYAQMYYGPMRSVYYRTTILLIQLLRELRQAAT